MLLLLLILSLIARYACAIWLLSCCLLLLWLNGWCLVIIIGAEFSTAGLIQILANASIIIGSISRVNRGETHAQWAHILAQLLIAHWLKLGLWIRDADWLRRRRRGRWDHCTVQAFWRFIIDTVNKWWEFQLMAKIYQSTLSQLFFSKKKMKTKSGSQ